jgi:hypothetical protein
MQLLQVSVTLSPTYLLQYTTLKRPQLYLRISSAFMDVLRQIRGHSEHREVCEDLHKNQWLRTTCIILMWALWKKLSKARAEEGLETFSIYTAKKYPYLNIFS